MVSSGGMSTQWSALDKRLNAREFIEAWCKVFVPNRVKEIVVTHSFQDDALSIRLRLYTGVTVDCKAIDKGLAALIRMLSEEI